MEIFQISPSADLSDQLIDELQKTLEAPSSSVAEVENILHVATALPPKGHEEKFFSPKYGSYLVSENPVQHLHLFDELKQERNTIPILTLVGDCNLLYGSHTAGMFQHFLEEQGYVNKEQAAIFRMLLQESLLNGIEYGNLGLAGKKDEVINHKNWFSDYRQLVEDELKKPENAIKPIIIQCYLSEDQIITSVTDAGQGFDYKSKLERVEKEIEAVYSNTLPHGMGIGLLRQFAHTLRYEDEGRTFIFGIKSSFMREKVLSGSEGFSLKNIRSNGRILVVDDQASNRQFAKFYLVSAGYKHIEEASSGEEALEKAINFEPDIILLDIIMPDIDGFTVCRKLKQDKRTVDIPILFLSGLTDVKNRIKGYRLGAVDYVNKPIDRNELIARTDIHIQNAIMFNSLQSFSLRIEKDLEKARASQENLLPNAADLNNMSKKHNISIEHVFDACDELAGDYWSIFDLNEETIAIAMADFTGHGVAAALNTVFLHALFHELRPHMHNPILLSQKMNTQLKKLLSIGNFATFVFALLNTRTGELEYVASGAPPLAISPADDKKEPHLLDCSGIPLGLVDTDMIDFELRKCTLHKGDTVILYSDALTETVHENGKMWMDEGLLTTIRSSKKSGESVKAGGILSLFKKTARIPLNDDLTLVSITLGGK